ncbi:related to ZAP1 - metalloregulatory protein involved in zinc-responsive transcriptional regulation [Melanopsichium pennsylvanicum]|uniref:Related to ZAP1 - metalloregulatory protein involved in zinc-responsive transcriptional regulation n=2 Tax=Melanopsichium pennsylvanicum TaxID=63383 RepID=A0AAJ4XFL6_9BASI|nr:related to ZAP1-metalloregulatory protein involved in zinc-responsive transcriptional regulation [Melanopsichium pennsylvanicum 4]SNX81575.1 related to ZAP1 - metalloregulatory protein involved in zinc-responsive transcriptional regulation [Melanopsichium pennsylvanicum]
MAAPKEHAWSSPCVQLAALQSAFVSELSTPETTSSRSPPPSKSQSTQILQRSSQEFKSSAQLCSAVICCDADHSVPDSCAADCRECPLSAPSSPCSDIHHISSACTQPSCEAATSSTSAVVCSSVIACCDNTACSDAPSSPCSQSDCSASPDCSSMTLAVPTIATCCTDETCESELTPSIKAKVGMLCKSSVPATSDFHSHAHAQVHRPHKECKDCRGAISSVGTSEGGRLYSSFQELLDCCCCSMPPMTEQCCVAPSPSPCRTAHPSPAGGLGLVAHDNQYSAHDAAQSYTPSSSIVTNATQRTTPGRDYRGSRASTVSTAATPQPVLTSPSSASHLSSAGLYASTSSQDKQRSTSGSSFDTISFEDMYPGLQSWNDCMFEQPHLHRSHGGCLPPAMTLCNSDLCQTAAPHSHWLPNGHNQRVSAIQASSIQPDFRPQLCQWGGCGERFWTVEELVAHVNYFHLARKDAAEGVQSPVDKSFLQGKEREAKQVAQAHTPAEAQTGTSTLECLWKDCHEFAMPEKLELGTFAPTTEADACKTGNATQDDKISLAMLQHLLHDHLGQHSSSPFPLKGQHSHPLPTPTAQHAGCMPRIPPIENAQGRQKRKNSENSALCSKTDRLFCRWEGCSSVFDSHAALTDHIETAHVGFGKAEYECRWLGCPRHASGHQFSQKQKVLRHIQTHTGDRPFKCTQCGKRFSEQNTLAQHVRTHTLERPYVCDYPGCAKAFSVAGSLTIHKRTHTGSKPFICNFPGCGKAFAESSNLTKHIRTHTGDKPFRCEECGKCFSRPDQASRHKKTHERKRAKTDVAVEEAQAILG